MVKSGSKNHRLVDRLEIHIDTDGLDHEIDYERLHEILEGYDILLGTLADKRTYNADDARVQQQETGEMKLTHRLYLSPAREGCFEVAANLYDDSEDPNQPLPLYPDGFDPVLEIIDCAARGDVERFEENLPSKLARKRVLEGIAKISPADNEQIKVVSGTKQKKTTELKPARIIPFEKLRPVEDDYTDAEIIGKIVQVDFEKHRLSFRPSCSSRRFNNIDYDPDIEDRLMDARHQRMCVKCKIKYNINGDIEDMRDADGIEALDLRDIEISEFQADGRTHKLKEPIVIKVELDETDQVYVGTYEPLGLVVYAEYQDELLAEVKLDLAWRWMELAQEDESNLAKDAISVRRTLLGLVIE